MSGGVIKVSCLQRSIHEVILFALLKACLAIDIYLCLAFLAALHQIKHHSAVVGFIQRSVQTGPNMAISGAVASYTRFESCHLQRTLR